MSQNPGVSNTQQLMALAYAPDTRIFLLGLLMLLAYPSKGLPPERAASAKQDPRIAAWNETPVQMVVSFTSRNGSGILSAALIELAQLAKDPRFSPVLSMPAAATETATQCLDSARVDLSGHMFDLARCVKVWPVRDKAPEPKVLEAAFARPVAKQGTAAFPAVAVSTFEFEQRLDWTQIPSRLVPKYEESPDGKLEPTFQTTKLLCNSGVTFIDQRRCQVHVVRRLAAGHPDFLVSQTGYRMKLLKVMPRSLAQKLALELRHRVERFLASNASGKMPKGAMVVSMAPTGPASARSQALPLRLAAAPTPPNLRAHFAAPWRSINADPSSVELDAAGSASLHILLFDDIDQSKVGEFGDWYGNFADALGRLAGPDCRVDEGNKARWHVDAAASLLFPRSLQRLLNPSPSHQPGPAISQELGWSGYILSQGDFEGVSRTAEGKNWYEAGVFSAGDPIVAVVVYKDRYGDTTDERASQVGALMMANPSVLLVISAPQREAIDGSGNYDTDPVGTLTPTTVMGNCRGRSWPSCLGKHPRVLVVAPSISAGQAQPPSLFNPSAFLLGGSTVRIAAPGNRVPVVSPCIADPAEPRAPGVAQQQELWRAHDEDGTSFAAPIVGLVLARLIAIAPEGVRAIPEAALWRVLATADPLSTASSALVEFGQVNAGRALRGFSEREVGKEGRATLYGPRSVNGWNAVVLPYPWNDALQNIERDGSGSIVKPGLARYLRGVLTYAERDSNGVFGTTQSLDFRRVLRIVRHRGPTGQPTDLFDLFYLQDLAPKGAGTLSVTVVRDVRIGGDPNSVAAPGFCRIDGITSPASGPSPSMQAQPACLYEWDPDSKTDSGFRPVDLTKVDDIVLPPLHRTSKFVMNIDPTDLRAVTRADSPWRVAFCETGPRRKVRVLLKPAGEQSIDELCSN